MPELPEVQTVVDGLIEKAMGKKIVSLLELRPGTISNFTDVTEPDLGVITAIKRRGKYILIETSNKYKLVIHLRMTGKLIFEAKQEEAPAHERASIIFKDGSRICFNDVRALGMIHIFKLSDSVPALDKLGPEPLAEEFNEQYLKEVLNKRAAPIKNLLLNQVIVAGIGNIYAAEILFRAGVSPLTPGNKLTSKQIRKLVKYTRQVLKEAIKCNGTTISDYRNVDDKTGQFQNFLCVYGKKVCRCGAKIKRIKQAGRSTYYCPHCQK